MPTTADSLGPSQQPLVPCAWLSHPVCWPERTGLRRQARGLRFKSPRTSRSPAAPPWSLVRGDGG